MGKAQVIGSVPGQTDRSAAHPLTFDRLIVGAVTGIDPSQDSPDFTPVLRQAASIIALDMVLAHAGYDAEHSHGPCRHELGIIALNRRNTERRWPKTPVGELSGNAFLACSIIGAASAQRWP